MATLKFYTFYPETGKKTFWMEKIIGAIYGVPSRVPSLYSHPDIDLSQLLKVVPKMHTIRAPKTAKKGDTLRLVMAEDGFQFCKKVKCESVQKLEIKKSTPLKASEVYEFKISGKYFGQIRFHAGVLVYTDVNLKELIRLDGFNDIKTFMEFFKEGGKFEIIHWTSRKY